VGALGLTMADQPATGTGWSYYVAKPRAPRQRGKGKGKGKGAAAAANPAGVPHTTNAALETFYEEQRVVPTDEDGASPLTRPHLLPHCNPNIAASSADGPRRVPTAQRRRHHTPRPCGAYAL
jgi:hypothetical protein